MKSNIFFTEFRFYKQHYTDNRKGAPKNYFALMKKGTAKLVSKGKTVALNEGEIVYIPKNLPYQSYWFGDNEVNFLSFGFNDILTDEFKGCNLQVLPNSAELSKRFSDIPLCRDNPDCKALSKFFYALEAALPVMEKNSPTPKQELFIKIKDTVAIYPQKNMGEIAKLCNISEPYLYSIFKSEGKISPNSFRNELLCKKAIDMLTTTDMKVEQISDSLGFSSASYFRKVLRQYTGKTPLSIRAQAHF